MYQKKLLTYLEFHFQNEELAFISALLLGYKDSLDRETIMIYSSSGAMHVLAVSGLHVGIIYLLLNSLFLIFKKFKYGKYFRQFSLFYLFGLMPYLLVCLHQYLERPLCFLLLLLVRHLSEKLIFIIHLRPQLLCCYYTMPIFYYKLVFSFPMLLYWELFICNLSCIN